MGGPGTKKTSLKSARGKKLGKIQVGSHDARKNEKNIIVTSHETYFAR